MVDALNQASLIAPQNYTGANSVRPASYFASLKEHQVLTEQQLSAQSQDIFRDTEARYLGFTNEVTTATKSVGIIARTLPFLNKLGWGVSLGYGFLDSLHKGRRAKENALAQHADASPAMRHQKAAIAETLAFHVMASWVVPVAFIMGAHKVAEKAVSRLDLTKIQASMTKSASGLKSPAVQKMMQRVVSKITPSGIHTFVPALAGIAIIPLITKFLDPWAENVLHKYIEPRLHNYTHKHPKHK